MAEAIIGALMRAHNPEPCVRLVDPSDRTAMSLTPLPMQLPQGVRTISHVPTRLRASTPSKTSHGMRGHDRVVSGGSIAELPLIRPVPRDLGPFAGIARS